MLKFLPSLGGWMLEEGIYGLAYAVDGERGKLITGFSAGPAGASLDIVGAFERAAPKTATVVEAGGAAVRVELTYLGPLPA